MRRSFYTKNQLDTSSRREVMMVGYNWFIMLLEYYLGYMIIQYTVIWY